MKINTSHQRKFLIICSAILLIWIGRLTVQYQIQRNLPPVQPIPEINPGVPMIIIDDIRNAEIMGTVSDSNIRIQSGEQIVVPDEELKFSLNIEHLGYIGSKRSVIKVEVPDWARFVASKNGKYFYTLDEKSAKRLSVKNQVYFATEEEAEGAGYLSRAK